MDLIRHKSGNCSVPVWDEFNRLERSIQSLFQDPFFESYQTARFPKIDVVEKGDKYIVYAALPGFTKNQIDVSCLDNRVVISGKREDKAEEVDRDGVKVLVREIARRNFNRAITFEKPCNLAEAKASFIGGELKVEVPKSEEVKEKVIKIKIE